MNHPAEGSQSGRCSTMTRASRTFAEGNSAAVRRTETGRPSAPGRRSAPGSSSP
jgi:hypothetical protein